MHFEGWGSEYDEWMRAGRVKQRTNDSHYGPLGDESDEHWDTVRKLCMRVDLC